MGSYVDPHIPPVPQPPDATRTDPVSNLYLRQLQTALTFEPNPNWTHFYAHGAEIQGYFQAFARKYDLERYIRLNSRVQSTVWDDELGVWKITLLDTVTGERVEDWAHVVINGTGILNTWTWPEILGLKDFKGPVMHSAQWNHKVDFAGKSVGVIGKGSSAVQIVPQLQPVTKHLDIFMRPEGTWISPPFGFGTLGDEFRREDNDPSSRQYTFSEEQKKFYADHPDEHLRLRRKIEAEINISKMRVFLCPSVGHVGVDTKALIPTWAPGCRRVTPGDGFLEALVKDNVQCVFSGIQKITPEGILTEDGTHHKFDILVCATGYKPAFGPAWEVVNGRGKTLKEDWEPYGGPNIYMGLSCPRFPNFYTIVGACATWSNGTLLPSIETSIEYSIQCMNKIQSEGIKKMELKQEALDELYLHMDTFHKATVFQEPCRSWFKSGTKDARIYLWPGGTLHFLKTIKTPRYEDYDIHYLNQRCRFAFLGSGDVKAQQTGDINKMSPYIRNSDTPWEIE
ncbi:hypothetical protein AYO21_02044 [Fonsecaea monophora]|uniref:L-ornithine N(5)-oxygenase n=1 Tax=Fonsecaea monophora TaxID=254056 RepID=A0A177FI30_9EURO|nr:hypothetical protein AYO21_02044 [Fonsecaea monophora]OAG43817.1 hypothetical protein AYO21_02044 [Fonsecaea monophora]